MTPGIIDAGEHFTQTSAEVIHALIEQSIAERGHCIVGLSGGSTPIPVYSLLGQMPTDWSRVSIFLIDERFVPADNDDSNQHMVRHSLLAHAPVPDAQICFPHTELSIDECILDYTQQLLSQWDAHLPGRQAGLPDLIILGMGPDGHIASLFPPLTDDLMDDTRLVAHTTTGAFAVHDRITLTLNPIAAAGAHVFLLKGNDKKDVWNEMLASTEGERRWPAKRVLEQPKVTVITGL